MKITWTEIHGAAQRSAIAARSFPLTLLVPVFFTSASYELLALGSHQAFGRRHPVIELLMLSVLCFPLGTTAEAVVARMLLVIREGKRPSSAQVGAIVRAPGLVSLLLRLNGLMMLWTMLAMMLAGVPLLLGWLVKGFAFAIAHHRTKMPPPHGSIFPYLMTFAVVEGVLFSRYSFVLPLFAAECRGSRDLFRAAIALAKSRLPSLSLVNAFEYGLVIAIAHELRLFESGWTMRSFAAAMLRLLLTSVVTTWFEMIKADLGFAALNDLERTVR